MIQIRCDEGFQGLINEKRIRKILKEFLNRLFDTQRGISILITNDAEIQKLNKQFRKRITQLIFCHGPMMWGKVKQPDQS